jgi:hypothetical protein
MGLWAPRRHDLVAYLQRRMDVAPQEGRNWMIDVEVALGRHQMEQALKGAGLAEGVEPERKS